MNNFDKNLFHLNQFDSLLLAPGPVQLHPEVQKILAEPMIHHRTPAFDQILKSTLQDLKYLFQTEQDVFILTSTGSGGMECLLVNVLHPQSQVMVVVSGKFGERWAEMAETFLKPFSASSKVHIFQVPWGEKLDLKSFQEYLNHHPEIDLVMTQACETSTGTLHPIKEMSDIVQKTKALFIVDAITALGATELKMDEWGIDGIIAGSQKAIMLPTGLSLLSYSKKAWQVINNNSLPRYYFDIRKEKKANEKGETFFSSNVSLIKALHFVLQQIKAQTLPVLINEIKNRAHYTKHMASFLNLKIYSQSPSPSLTALTTPVGIDSQRLREHIEKNHHITLMGGQDNLKGKIIRIGHMGYILDEHLHRTSIAIAKSMIDMNVPIDLNQVVFESKKYLKF